MADPRDPHITAWADQFGALLRDKVRGMMDAQAATGWNSIAHAFDDPSDGDTYRLHYEDGQYFLTNITEDESNVVELDPVALGVFR